MEIDSEKLSAFESLDSPDSVGFIEFYANVNDASDDCKIDGTFIHRDQVVIQDITGVSFPYNEQYKPEDQEDCFPRSTESVVIKIGFTFPDPFYNTPEEMMIYDPQGGNDITQDGSIV